MNATYQGQSRQPAYRQKLSGVHGFLVALVLFALPLALAGCGSGSNSAATSTRIEQSATRFIVLIDAGTGKVSRAFQDVDGAPSSAVSDGRGGWYVAGNFTHVGAAPSPGLSHLRSDGAFDPAFAPDLPENWAGWIEVNGNVVYAGDHGVFALDAESGKRLWHVLANQYVNSLVYGNRVLYVGGSFSEIGGVARDGIAALDPNTGKPTPWQVRVRSGSTSGDVNTVAVTEGAVYLGGVFNRVGDAKVNCDLAAVSPRTGRVTWLPSKKAGVETSIHSTCSSDVVKIVVSNGQVLAGSWHDGFASFDIRSRWILPWSRAIAGSAYPYATAGNTVYLGGHSDYGFDRAGGKAANNLVSVVLPQGKFTSWRPKIASCVHIATIAVSGNKVLVGGAFSHSGCE